MRLFIFVLTCQVGPISGFLQIQADSRDPSTLPRVFRDCYGLGVKGCWDFYTQYLM
jgi:hypothetical protein